ncbi:MAG: preprotein translocase subunit SecE [Clostridia bacterium]|nr:preprotein translocase subunit SecE [Clostridia bacterium]
MAKDPNSEAAKKVADAEKASKKKAGKSGGPNIFVRMGKAIAKFFKDLKGETKKIVWPNAKSVLKNTGIVIAVVLIIGIGIWLVDWGLSAGIDAVLGINTSSSEETSEESSEAETTTAAVVNTTVAETTAATEAESQAE